MHNTAVESELIKEYRARRQYKVTVDSTVRQTAATFILDFFFHAEWVLLIDEEAERALDYLLLDDPRLLEGAVLGDE